MASIDLIGSAQDYVNAGSYQILDTLYSQNCVLLNNAIEIISGKTGGLNSIPLPLIGFQYKPTGSIELLNFSYSSYPYLNKQQITNSVIQNQTRFSLLLMDPINGSNPVVAALLKRQTLIKLLEKYQNAGGLFTVLTLWGTISNCVLESFYGVESGEGLNGTSFMCNFMKPLFDTSSASSQLSSTLNSLSNGGVGSI